jgi:DNA-binding LytR/AlgR family response regulator
MKQIRCLITDDEPLARSLLRTYVDRLPTLQLLGECVSATETIAFLEKEKVDLLFLDIQMADLSGMSLAKTIHDRTRIIFTTAFEQYAVEGYKVNALGYLLKPFSFEEFSETVNRAIKTMIEDQASIAKIHKDFIMIKADYKIWQLKLKDITFIEGLKDYVKIHRDTETKALMPLMSMRSLEEILPSDQFMRVHRSFIVNLDKIIVIERNQILFADKRITVSDNYKEKFNLFLEERFGS